MPRWPCYGLGPWWEGDEPHVGKGDHPRLARAPIGIEAHEGIEASMWAVRVDDDTTRTCIARRHILRSDRVERHHLVADSEGGRFRAIRAIRTALRGL